MSFDADPLYNEKNAFYKGLFQTVVDDASAKTGGGLLVLRSRIELDPAAVARDLNGGTTDIGRATYALALHKLGKTTEAMKIADTLLDSTYTDVRITIATILARETDRFDDAIYLLSSVDDNLEAIALLIHIYLVTNRLSLAQQTLQSAKAWAQDAELIQLAESWVALKAGGTDQYQSAFYTAQEFADAAGSPLRMLLAQAVSEIHLGNYDEASDTLQTILAEDPQMADALANLVVLQTITGKDTTRTRADLESADPNHTMVVELQDKISEFESLKTAYTFVEA